MNLVFFTAGYMGCILTVVGADAAWRVWKKVKCRNARRVSNLRNIRQTMKIKPDELDASIPQVKGECVVYAISQ